MSDQTAVTELIIDASDALTQAQQAGAALDKYADSSEKAAAATDDLAKSITTTGEVADATQRQINQQAKALDQFRSSTDDSYAAQQRLQQGIVSLQNAQQGLIREVQNGSIGISTYQQQLEQLKAREQDLQAASDGLKAGTVGVNDAMSALQAPVQKTAALQRDQTQAQKDLTNAAQALKDRLDPTAVAQRNYGAAVQGANDLVKAGLLTEGEHAASLALLKGEYDNQVAAIKRATEGNAGLFSALGLTSQQLSMTEHVARSFSDSVAAGASPMQALGREAGRLGEILPAIFGGATLGSFAAGATAVLALAAPFILISAAASGFIAEQKAFNLALTTSGSTIATTTDQLISYGDSIASAAGLSASQSRAIVLSLAQVGTSGAILGQITNEARDFGVATGVDATKGATNLAQALNDPLKGLNDLNASLHFSSGQLADYVIQQTDAGNSDAARQAILEALGVKLQGLADHQLTGLAGAWEAVGKAASNAWDLMAKNSRAPTLPEQIDSLTKQLNGGPAPIPNIGSPNYSMEAPQLLPSNSDLQNELQSDLIENTEAQVKAALKASQQAMADLASQAVQTANQYDYFDSHSESLNRTIDELTRQMNALSNQGLANTEWFKDLQEGVDRYKTALDNLQTPHEAAMQQLDNEAIVLSANIGDRARLAGELQIEADRRTALANLTQSGKTAADVDGEATQKLTNLHDKLAQAIQDQSTIMAASTAATLNVATAYLSSTADGIRADAERTASLEKLQNSYVNVNQRVQELLDQGYAKELEAYTKNVAALTQQTSLEQALATTSAQGSAALQDQAIQNQAVAQTQGLVNAAIAAGKPLDDDQIAALREKISLQLTQQSVAKQTVSANQQLEQYKDQLTVLRAQVSTIGTMPDEQAAYLAELQETLRIQREQPGIADDLKQKLIEAAGAQAELTAQLQESQQIAGDIGDALATGLEQGGDEGIKSFEDALKRSLIELGKAMLFEPLIQPVIFSAIGGVNSLLGGSATAGGSGSLLSSGGNLLNVSNLFGGGSLFGTGGIAGAVNGWAQSAFPSIFGAPGIGGTPLGSELASQGGFGAELGTGQAADTGLLGGTTLTSLLGGIGAGFGAGSLLNSLVGGKSTGGMVGSGVGAAAGAIGAALAPETFGVSALVGGLLGGGAGGLLGGLFGGNPSVGPNFATNFAIDSTNGFHVYDARSDNGGSQQDAVNAGQQVVTAVNTFLAGIGATISPNGGGGAVGDRVGNISGHYYDIFGGQENDFQDAQSAMQDYVVRLLKSAKLEGVGSDIATAIAHSTATTLDQLTSDAQFGAQFQSTLQQFRDGGSTSATAQAIASATQAIDSAFASIKSFRDETAALGLSVDDANSATDAYIQSLLGLQQATPDTAYQQSIKVTTAQFAELQTQMVALGYSASDAADQVSKGLNAALAQIRSSYAASYDQAVRSANGEDYIDTLSGITASYNATSADVRDAGRDPTTLYYAQLNQAIGQLDESQLENVVSFFQNLDPVIEQFATTALDKLQAADAASAQQAALQQNQQLTIQYYDAMADAAANAGDAASQASYQLQSALLSFDVQAQQTLAQVQSSGGDILLAETTLAQQRQNIIDKSNQAIVQSSQDALDSLVSSGRSIQQYLDKLNATSAGGLSPTDQLTNAQGQFEQQLQLARANDPDALSSITQYADQLLSAATAQYASTAQDQAIVDYVRQSLETLPATQDYQQHVIDQLTTIAQNGSSTIDALGVLQADTNQDGEISRAEFNAWAAKNVDLTSTLASALGISNGSLDQIFTRLDLNGDGETNAAEIQSSLLNQIAGTSAVTNDLISLLQADTNADGEISRAEFNNWAATNVNQASDLASALGVSNGSLSDIYTKLDLNGDGEVTAAEIQQVMLNQIANSTSAANSNLSSVAAATAAGAAGTSAALAAQLSAIEALSNTGVYSTSIEQQIANSVSGITPALNAVNSNITTTGYNDALAFGLNTLSLGDRIVGGLNLVVNAVNAIPPAIAGFHPVTISSPGIIYTNNDADRSGLEGNAVGGLILGPGSGTSDSIVRRLSNGEFVMNAAATAKNLPALQAMNSGGSPAGAGSSYAELVSAVTALQAEVRALRGDTQAVVGAVQNGTGDTTDEIRNLRRDARSASPPVGRRAGARG